VRLNKRIADARVYERRGTLSPKCVDGIVSHINKHCRRGCIGISGGRFVVGASRSGETKLSLTLHTGESIIASLSDLTYVSEYLQKP